MCYWGGVLLGRGGESEQDNASSTEHKGGKKKHFVCFNK